MTNTGIVNHCSSSYSAVSVLFIILITHTEPLEKKMKILSLKIDYTRYFCDFKKEDFFLT